MSWRGWSGWLGWSGSYDEPAQQVDRTGGGMINDFRAIQRIRDDIELVAIVGVLANL